MSVSLVILPYRTGRVLSDCLIAALRVDEGGDVVLLNNGNPREDAEIIDRFAAENPKLPFCAGRANVGCARACNLGVWCSSIRTLF